MAFWNTVFKNIGNSIAEATNQVAKKINDVKNQVVDFVVDDVVNPVVDWVGDAKDNVATFVVEDVVEPVTDWLGDTSVINPSKSNGEIIGDVVGIATDVILSATGLSALSVVSDVFHHDDIEKVASIVDSVDSIKSDFDVTVQALKDSPSSAETPVSVPDSPVDAPVVPPSGSDGVSSLPFYLVLGIGLFLIFL